jgi:hypothetical protein
LELRIYDDVIDYGLLCWLFWIEVWNLVKDWILGSRAGFEFYELAGSREQER